MKDIAKNIRHFRIVKNITQDELAEKLFVTRQTVSNYETGKSRPDVDMLVRIAEVLETDIHQIIYGPEPKTVAPSRIPLLIGAGLTLLLGLLWHILYPYARRLFYSTYFGGWFYLMISVVRPLYMLCLGWTLSLLTGMALKKNPIRHPSAAYWRSALVIVLLLWLVLNLWFYGATFLNDYLYDARIRGEWVTVEENGVPAPAWSKLPPPVPQWLGWVYSHFLFLPAAEYYWVFLILGGLLWLLAFPKPKNG